MKFSDYLVDRLIKYGVTDAFGIPGGVIVKFLYSVEKRNNEILPHLTFNEQTAGFAACGYAQASGNPGVAYATRGPGITNMVTCIAEAWQESIPVIFITAHSTFNESGMRFLDNQENDIVTMVSGITKYASRIDSVEEASGIVNKAIEYSISGRKGPVLIDVNSFLWDKDLPEDNSDYYVEESYDNYNLTELSELLDNAEKPVLLIGDGVRHCVGKESLIKLCEKFSIPVISSRGAQDILAGYDNYFGYIGSHGIRYANFILSKSDLILSLGNRLAFPVSSQSYSLLMKNKKIIRVDIDRKEFNRKIENSINICCDAHKFVSDALSLPIELVHDKWLDTCKILKNNLLFEDINDTVAKISDVIKNENNRVFVSDVGNNEFFVSRAFELAGTDGLLFSSRAFGSLGLSIGKAIGVYYALKTPVTCIIGDQGLQMNIQELQFFASNSIPIKIFLLNNEASGMIYDIEKRLYEDKFIHVNSFNGYTTPSFLDVAGAYGIKIIGDINEFCKSDYGMYELKYDFCEILTPSLPIGNECQNMVPLLENERYNYLNSL